ncbi:MAG: c-type cytochrome [Betaproteobacteria bacterium]
MTAQPRSAVAAALALLGMLVLLGACQRPQGGVTSNVAPAAASTDGDKIAAVPLGDVAGVAGSTYTDTIRNPFTGDPQAIAQGRQMFVSMNCAGCHGYDAKGGMGPNLTDRYWRYNGVPVSVYKSIYEGRPQGMPAWNPALPPQVIWKLVAYIESLGGTAPAGAYEASLRGDRPGDNVAPEAQSTPAQPASAGKDSATDATAAASPPEARPDAGGKP